jgi:branched-chain amino acid transport system permease protein
MFAASWDILSGYTGQVNFGHAAFIGTGAYTVALLSKYSPDTSNELALLAAVGTAALLGLAIGIPCLRLKGPYLALATLSVAGRWCSSPSSSRRRPAVRTASPA